MQSEVRRCFTTICAIIWVSVAVIRRNDHHNVEDVIAVAKRLEVYLQQGT